ncbi:MAG: hypothetical protein LBI38_00095 [Oscillospiraceae bacterium]|jgi:hypothetical protein|nr:hypothetical protein [Oscillospiraceae bacterium]
MKTNKALCAILSAADTAAANPGTVASLLIPMILSLAILGFAVKSVFSAIASVKQSPQKPFLYNVIKALPVWAKIFWVVILLSLVIITAKLIEHGTGNSSNANNAGAFPSGRYEAHIPETGDFAGAIIVDGNKISFIYVMAGGVETQHPFYEYTYEGGKITMYAEGGVSIAAPNYEYRNGSIWHTATIGVVTEYKRVG